MSNSILQVISQAIAAPVSAWRQMMLTSVENADEFLPPPSGTLFYEHIAIPKGPGIAQLQGILDIIPPLGIKSGPWIAGGAVRRLFEGKSLEGGDIDIFFDSSKDWRQFDAVLSNYELIFKSNRATTYLVNGLQVQIIKRRFYACLTDVFKDFDFSVCQIATDGKTIAATAQCQQDIKDGMLRFAPMGTLAKHTLVGRLVKYVNHGFIPEPGLYETIVKGGLDYASAYDIFQGSEEVSIYDHEEKVEELMSVADMNAGVMRTIARKMGLEISND